MEKTLYPKTERIGDEKIVVTEKLDGSNLGIFKLNGEIYFAQRNNVYKMSELIKDNAYKGLMFWAEQNKTALMTIRENSLIFGEWLGMGKLKYDFPLKFYMFAKANISDDIECSRISYIHEYFHYSFEDGIMAECIGIVPVVLYGEKLLDVSSLDLIYEKYVESVGRNVEGFVVRIGGVIKKYVRMKDGKLSDHKA